ncbi:tetratricopeptide repeat protein [Stappia sp.]|uniref:tetratricopeptide repeat protein n=1 Tax=Stappia sp. TaxID=1870903 RepID=UPI0032D9939C
MPSVLLFADMDSQIIGALPFARSFATAGWDVTFCVPRPDHIPAPLLRSVQDDFAIVSEPIVTLAFSDLLDGVDAVGIFAAGSKIARFRADMALVFAMAGSRPFIFTGYNGVVYERYEEGVFWRLGYDVICLNGPRDALLFQAAVTGSRFAHQPYVITGLNKPRTESLPTPRPTAVFAEQVIVPQTYTERRWMFRGLSALAAHNPDWDLIIKPRIRPGERTFHRSVLHPEQAIRRAPANLRMSYESLETLLASASLLLTVSSTSFFDAIAARVPVAVIGDFGVRNSIGTHYFANSGVVTYLRTPEKLEDIVTRQPSKDWLYASGATDAHSPETLIEAIGRWTPGPLPEAMPVEQMAPLSSTEAAASAADRAVSHGNTALRNRNFRGALTSFASALEAEPACEPAVRGLVTALLETGEIEEARKHYETFPQIVRANQNRKTPLSSVVAKTIARLGASLSLRP